MKFVRAVFSLKFALEAICVVFRANRNSAAFAFAVYINDIKSSQAIQCERRGRIRVRVRAQYKRTFWDVAKTANLFSRTAHSQ
jgi:hypothetical protein